MPKKLIRVVTYLDETDPTYRRLKDEAHRRDLSISQLAAEYIRRGLEPNKEEEDK
jgi:hypothetical protein